MILIGLKIQRAFRFFKRPVQHVMGVNHRRFQIAVTEQLLDGANIDIKRFFSAGWMIFGSENFL